MRYVPGQQIYLQTVLPAEKANVVLNNWDPVPAATHRPVPALRFPARQVKAFAGPDHFYRQLDRSPDLALVRDLVMGVLTLPRPIVKSGTRTIQTDGHRAP